MPDGFVSLLIDDITEKTLVDKRCKITDLADEVKVITITGEFNKKARSRWLKTSMRQYIKGDFLFIDCDTVICENLQEIEEIAIDIGCVLDEHCYLETWFKNNPRRKKDLQSLDTKLGFESTIQSNTHFNSGVIFCRDIPLVYEFFREWHRLWLQCHAKGITIDQMAFNQVNLSHQGIISELDGIWNCQILCDGAVRYLGDSKIIHYFIEKAMKMKNSVPYLLANSDILKKIKNTGNIDNEIKEKLLFPRGAFSSEARLIIPDSFLDSLSFIFFNKLFKGRLLVIIEVILAFILKLRKSFF
jgi:hypothetical protein